MRLFQNIINWFRKAINLFKIEKVSDQENMDNSVMKNQDIYENLVTLFNNGISNESFGKTMLFPMSFYIIMHIDDYEDRKKAFPSLVKGTVEEFYRIIEERKADFPNYEQIGRKWVFQFSPCRTNGSIETDDKKFFTVERGSIVSTASLYNDVIDTFEDIQIDRNIKVSIKCNNSNVIKTANLNLKALAGVDILGEGFFAIPFDDKSSQPPTSQESEVIIENAPLAELSYVKKNTDTVRYTMKYTSLIISGMKDPRTMSNIFKLEYSNIDNGHVQIKYENKEFSLCAFGETRLNEKRVELSKPGNIIWVPLADNSEILMNDEIQFKFKKLC